MAENHQSKPLNKQKAQRPWDRDTSNGFLHSSSLCCPGSAFPSKAQRCHCHLSLEPPLCCHGAGSTSFIGSSPATFSAKVGTGSCLQRMGLLPRVLPFGLPRQQGTVCSSEALTAGTGHIWILSRDVPDCTWKAQFSN